MLRHAIYSIFKRAMADSLNAGQGLWCKVDRGQGASLMDSLSQQNLSPKKRKQSLQLTYSVWTKLFMKRVHMLHAFCTICCLVMILFRFFVVGALWWSSILTDRHVFPGQRGKTTTFGCANIILREPAGWLQGTAERHHLACAKLATLKPQIRSMGLSENESARAKAVHEQVQESKSRVRRVIHPRNSNQAI